MKISTRMTLSTAALAVLVFGSAGLAQIKIEEHDLRAVAERETTLLGRSLQVAFENAVRDRQIEDVTETLQTLAEVDPDVSIFVFDEGVHLMGASRGAEPRPLAYEIARGVQAGGDAVVRYSEEGDIPVLNLAFPLHKDAPAPTAALVLEKPLKELRRDISTTRTMTALITFGFILVVSGSTWVVAHRTISTPLSRLTRNMQRFREGGLAVESGEEGRDEVGEALTAFKRLAHDLQAARLQATREVEARLQMERCLQDADKLVTLGQLSAVMAHEIGSPLQVLEGRARALKKHAEEPEVVRTTADMLVEQTQRITRIVVQLLSTTRRRPPARTSVNVELLTRRVRDLLEFEAREKGVELVIRCDTDPQILADGDQVQQVVLNLIRNALSAAPPRTQVVVRLSGNEGQLVIDVDDHGSGIPESVRAHLFEPFFTTKAEIGGSGLGLSVVRSIARAHSGTAEFIEKRGPGCLVRVVLPRGLPA